MEKLNTTKQGEIQKLSKVRLTSKLTQAGVTLEQLETMDRSAMLEAWVEIVAGGKEQVVGAKTASLGYDIDLERQQFELEKNEMSANTKREK